MSNSDRIIVIDTETTGVTPGKSELLQVSIINANGNTLYDKYIKPTVATEWNGAERLTISHRQW